MNRRTTLTICGGILLVAAAALVVIFSTEPKVVRGGAVKQTSMLVEVTSVERGTFQPVLVATGTVTPERDVVLQSRVAGQVEERARGLTPGRRVERGQALLQIDADDYALALREQQSALHQARADLSLEMGRQQLAREEYEVLGSDLPPGEAALALRKPQLEAARVRVEAAEAAVARAELDLSRTTLRAPFDAHVLSREVDVGSQVAPGDALARLVGIDTYWVLVSLPLSELRWVSFPDPETGEGGSEVAIRNRSAWPEGVTRHGRVQSSIGALDDQTRMARLVVSIPDPLALNPQLPPGTPKLVVGEFVEARIVGKPIADVIRFDRDYLRKNYTVWLMQEGRLRIVPVDVLLRDAEHVYVSSGLHADARMVTTHLANVVDGAELRLGDAAQGG